MSITTEDIIQHAGVKGMKWGVRKDRPKSKNVLKAESNKSKRAKELKEVNKTFLKETNYGNRKASKSQIDILNSAKRELRYSKEDLASVKILEKLNSKPKTNQQLAQEAKYKDKGFHKDEAAVQAYKNIRVKQALVAGAATAITVGSVYAGYKISEEYMDKVIKSGSSLQNVTAESNQGVRDAFYSSKNALDKMKYKGFYGKQIQDSGGSAFVKEIKTLKDIKRVSPKNAQKALQELVSSDPEFAKGFEHQLRNQKIQGEGGLYLKKVRLNIDSIASGKINKDIYETFNANLVDHSPGMQKLTDKYYKTLSDKGYNAIKDVNDSKYSGYRALNPIIAFDTKGKVSVVDVRELSKAEVDKHLKKSINTMSVTPFIRDNAILPAAVGATIGLVKTKTKRASNKAVNKYISENPNTKLSQTEIRRMLERGK